MANQPVYLAGGRSAAKTIVNADGTSAKDLWTGGSSGSKVFSPVLATDETAVRVIQFGLYDGSSFFLLGSVSVPIGAGTGGVAPMNAFANIPNLPIDNDGNRFIYVPSGYKLQMKAEATLTSGKTLYATAIGSDF